ncbi:lipase family protein [Amycolatopsis sp. PS_44_ISF1]|uniref:alpha/beta hydrolase family protein n=1 Tax=Amycolatopsis sp. PS_44_ISF1 TaxID=2974917 RepID=UPI0028E095B1|nr:lipase family protein [Amycolatopsis sp. PS_44_ISF1]MDT8912992.1 alpha/beta fold hydrolase [Amycolatopsis sp. PS_44_ISF1]
MARNVLVHVEDVATPAGLPAGSRVHRVTYRSANAGGAAIEVTGLVLRPARPDPGKPLLAWAHGTTGLDDRCAPSTDPGLAGYTPLLRGFLEAGYPIAATDYEGLGTPGDHPYLVPGSEARSVLDSVRAARALDPALGPDWVAVGHSQGGQAALAAAELDPEAPRETRLLGAVAYAPAPNMTGEVAQLGQAAAPAEQALYTMMLIGLRTQHPELDYSDFLTPRARELVSAARTECIDDLIERFRSAGLAGSDFVPRDPASADRLRRWFAANELGHRPIRVPVLVAQGDADPVVRPELTNMTVAALRSHGGTVELRSYPGADHGKVLTASRDEVSRFLGGLR